jgi:multicomponent Na+:H+ antiporter subunit B
VTPVVAQGAETATVALVVALSAFLLTVAVLTALARDTVVAVVVFAGYSLGLAILWLVFRAPDVGLTEAAVGAGVTTSLFVVTLRKTVRPTGRAAFDLSIDPRSLVAPLAFVGVLGVTVPALPAVGDPTAPAFAPDGAAAYYLANASALGSDNVVTAVLVVFRGFDTFGEVAVVFAAAVATLVVLGREVP